MLAVEHRAASSTQKQALNAIVFLMHEGLRRDLGTFDFQRARARQKIPTVLTREECQRLFGKLPGTNRLMAQLMYGAGLRLMELLRLRVHHLERDRRPVVDPNRVVHDPRAAFAEDALHFVLVGDDAHHELPACATIFMMTVTFL